MMDELRQQAERFGTDVRDGEITSVDFSKRPFTATTDDGTAIKADTVIIATGASAKYLAIDSCICPVYKSTAPPAVKLCGCALQSAQHI